MQPNLIYAFVMSVTVFMFLARLILSQLRLEMPHSDMQTTQRSLQDFQQPRASTKETIYVHNLYIASAACFFRSSSSVNLPAIIMRTGYVHKCTLLLYVVALTTTLFRSCNDKK